MRVIEEGSAKMPPWRLVCEDCESKLEADELDIRAYSFNYFLYGEKYGVVCPVCDHINEIEVTRRWAKTHKVEWITS